MTDAREAPYRDLIPGIEDHKPKQSYSPEQIRTVACIYAQTGVLKQCQEQTGIPLTTLHQWKEGSEDWATAIEKYRNEKTDEQVAIWDAIQNRFTGRVLAEVDNVDVKSANDLKALVIGAATAQDKGRLLKGLPSSISSTGHSLEGMAESFAKLVNRVTEKDITP